jgi:predicted ATPase
MPVARPILASGRAFAAMNLPIQQTPFIGRLPELRAAGELLRAHRLLTLVGAGGSGKTRLALELAAEAAERFPEGVFWVPLAPVRDPDLVEQTIARSVGANVKLVEHLMDMRVLLVLDNMEQVVTAADMLGSLLTACPGVRALVTSREPLRIAPEQRFTVETLCTSDAVALFTERARAVDSTFVEDSTVEAICTRLDCLPLAVELAATRVNVLAPEVLLARLDRRLPLLTGGRRDMPARHQTLKATIEWSEDLLQASERAAFHRLAIFSASFDLQAAEGVCGTDLAVLSSLVDKCLVARIGGGRFALLETVREFADEHLTASERDELACRHAEYFAVAAEVAAGVQNWPTNPETFGKLDDDIANLRAALTWTRSNRLSELTLRLGIALSRYWIDRGHRHDAGTWLEAARLTDASVPAPLRAASLEAAGLIDYFMIGVYDEADRYYRQSLTLYRELGNKQRVAFLLNRVGRLAALRAELVKANCFHRDALALYEAMADDAGRAATLHLLAEVASRQRRYEDAERLFADAIRLALNAFPGQVRHSLHSLGDLELNRGDYARAFRYYQESLQLTSRSERRSLILRVAGFSSALAGLGAYPLAARLWGAVDANERALGFRMLSDERKRYEHWANTARSRLGEEPFRAAFMEGAGLQIEEALSQAEGYRATEPVGPIRAAAIAEWVTVSSAIGRFEREGEYWTIGYDSRVLRVRDSKGVRLLAVLLADPERPHAALDLERLGALGGETMARAVASGNAGELVDDEARRAYRARAVELHEAIEAAVMEGRPEESGLLREELELSRALGLGGRPRYAGSIAERARLNVTRALRKTILRISSADAALGVHLNATIHTGAVCVYRPDPRAPLVWHVRSDTVKCGTT